ncbi:type II toxin-antitoxin system YafQ family toxin [Paracoccus marcusii]|jgi:mRNA interferase YafQ|uniref:type II toxin-antitoxin system YafQ family toxin n=1 Tax=Paracoccus marcusii TaxID=59779 RepID=UPI00249231C9|nr:type II toxin-antitoxin system YafQ family toxin [Paracoccus marcusii]
MKGILYTTKFRRDVKREMKTDPGVEQLLRDVIAVLRAGQEMPPRMKDHPLHGDWKDHRDCHLKPDLVLIYKSDEADITLARLGSHSELF